MGRSRESRGSGTIAEAARGYRGRNARAPSLKAGVLCTKGASLNDQGAGAPITAPFLRVGKVPAAVPEANTGTPRVVRQTKQNKTNAPSRHRLCPEWRLVDIADRRCGK